MEAVLTDHGLSAYEILTELDSAPVECDGFATLATTALTYAGINHEVLFGMLDTGNGSLPHFCIKVQEAIFDYRARMWAGESAAHGAVTSTHIGLYKDFQNHTGRKPHATLFFILYGDSIENFFKKLLERKRCTHA